MSNDLAPVGAATEGAVGGTEQSGSAETAAPTVTLAPRPGRPDRQCDVVMKGGIVSGVVYPGALNAIGDRYRIRGIGGASAGAIGAAVGAAAELGGNEGFRKLSDLPADLGEGRLAKLFQPSRRTRPLLRLVLTASGSGEGGAKRRGLSRVSAVAVRAIVSFPIAAVLGALAGLALLVGGIFTNGWSQVLVIAAGAIVAVIGLFAAVLFRLYRLFTGAIPENMFGICTGHVDDEGNPGFTDWLANTVDDLSGLPQTALPLRFGQLWTGSERTADVATAQRDIDLRMITTCLSESRPYELPMEARKFFYEPSVWRKLFPHRVVDALDRAPDPGPPPGADEAMWSWDNVLAQGDGRGFRRLPEAKHLPVIVAVRLSLSFPLLISAVPLWSVDRRSEAFKKAWKAASRASFRTTAASGAPGSPTAGSAATSRSTSSTPRCHRVPPSRSTSDGSPTTPISIPSTSRRTSNGRAPTRTASTRPSS